jgi:GT2 family glycosyltransferase
VKVFTEYPDVGCVGGRILLYDPEDAPITIDTRDNPVEIPPRRFVRAGVMHGANLSFRRSTLETIGGFDPHFGAGTEFPCEDIDAIAATLWSGSPARFDPRPIVYHHHGRRAKDVPALMAGYAKGRGAYYAKYVFRPDTRWLYTIAWLYVAYQDGDLLGLRGELQSARRYARQRGHLHSAMLTLIAIAAPAAFVAGKTVGWAKRKFGLAKQVAAKQIS